jgi:hypothetical protein
MSEEDKNSGSSSEEDENIPNEYDKTDAFLADEEDEEVLERYFCFF